MIGIVIIVVIVFVFVVCCSIGGSYFLGTGPVETFPPPALPEPLVYKPRPDGIIAPPPPPAPPRPHDPIEQVIHVKIIK